MILLFLALQKPVPVKPYATPKGKIVQPHVRTPPNKTKLDNYSSKPNISPTGKKGTKNPATPPPQKKPKL